MDVQHLRLIARIPSEGWDPKRDTRRRVVATIRSTLTDPEAEPKDRLLALRVLIRLARLNGVKARDLISDEAVASGPRP
jgi:hypothetical protein